MLSIVAVVVTYHPGPVVLDNMRQLARQLDRIIVVDNGSAGASVRVVDAVEKLPGVRVIRNPSNLGIATALNVGILEALQADAQWIATFDQDSTITENYFQNLLAAYEVCPQTASVGMVVPRGWSDAMAKIMRIGSPVWAFVMGAHSSGSLIKSDVIRLVGLYDDDLFIDFVDMEYCLRLKQHGFKVMKAMCVVLEHELGSKLTRNVLGFKISVRDHAVWRSYYIFRNRLLLYRRFYSIAIPWMCVDTGLFIFSMAQLCIEPNRRGKIHAMWDGFWDALHNRSGRHPQYPPPNQS